MPGRTLSASKTLPEESRLGSKNGLVPEISSWGGHRILNPRIVARCYFPKALQERLQRVSPKPPSAIPAQAGMTRGTF